MQSVRRLFTSSARPVLFGEVLDRPWGYGLGFMTDLAGHAVARWCAASSGHSGNVGSSFAMADPESGLAVAALQVPA